MRRWVYLASALVALTASCFTGGRFLYSWDSVNFALGVERIDVGAHRPHPPGYLALIAGARLFGAVTDAPAALVIVSALAAALSCVLIWEIGRATTRSEGAALLGWSVAVSSPLLWFYASTGEVYALELLSSVVCAAAAMGCLLRPTSNLGPIAMGAALGLAVTVKPTVAALMTPLWLYVAARLGGTPRRWALAAGVVGVCLGCAVLVSVVPPGDLLSLTHDQVASTVQSDARFDPLHLLNRRLRDVLYALCAALGLGGVVAIALRRRRPALPIGNAALVVWAGPYLLMCVLVHFPKPGYALPLIAPLAVWLAGVSTGRSTRVYVVLAIAIAALNLGQFTLRPWPAAVTGGDKRYALKTWPEKLATEANAILRPSLASIGDLDRAVERVLASIPEPCGGRTTALLIESSGPVTWRHAMYYLRDPLVLQVGGRPDETLAAQRGELVSGSSPQSRAVDCVGLVSRGGLALSGGSVVKRTSQAETIYWAPGPSTVSWSTADGVSVDGATVSTRPD
jgi:Dolichyl-phosphate-mannose-protein mannosyltransferase